MSKRQLLQQNLNILRQVFLLKNAGAEADAAQIALLRQYGGFGGLRCVMYPAATDADIAKWQSDRDLFPLMRELHELIKANTANEAEYLQYIDSIRSSALTAFYTPSVVAQVIVQALCEAGAAPQDVLEPSLR